MNAWKDTTGLQIPTEQMMFNQHVLHTVFQWFANLKNYMKQLYLLIIFESILYPCNNFVKNKNQITYTDVLLRKTFMKT